MYSPHHGGNVQIRFGGPLTPAIKVLLIANAAIFLLTFVSNVMAPVSAVNPADSIVVKLFIYLGVTPLLFWSQFTLWMPLTYMFLHADLFHVLFNMFALWMFGGDVEKVLGARRFVTYYLLCGAGAGLLVAALQPGLAIPTIGASGAIYGVILAFGLFFPNRVILLGMLFPIKAKYFVMIIGAMVFFSSLSAHGDGISHVAHLGGLVFGFIYIRRNRILQFFGNLLKRRRRKPDLRVIYREEVRRMFEDDDDNFSVH